jgi:activator of 2-hydroxyglutaryl-CoA dehydratase
MLARIGAQPPYLFAGGAAKNSCLVKLVEEMTQSKFFVPEHPHIIGALGAALLAGE